MMKMASASEELDTLMVGLYVYGEHLAPENISRELQAVPTRSQLRGELKDSASSKPIHAKVGMWELRSSIASLVLGEHISEIISKLGNSAVDISSLDGVDDVHLDIYAAGTCPGDNYRYLDFELALEHVRKLAALGASIRFSLSDEDRR